MPNSTSWTIFISYLLCPTVFYLFGKYMIDRLHNTNNIIMFWFLSIFAFSIILYISTSIDITRNGFINITRSFAIYGAENDAGMAATLYGMIASLGLMGFAYFFVKQNSNFIRYMYILLSLLSLITVVHLVNRTGLVVVIICFIVMSFYIFRHKKAILIFTYVIMVITFVLLIHFGIIDQSILEAYQSRDTENEGVNSVGGRTDLWNLALNNLLRYPFGWLDTGVAYSHNLWLDIARVSGIIPFIIFLIVSVKIYTEFFKLLKKKEETVVPLFLGLHICFFLTAFVEPLIEALPLYFYLYMMLWGMQSRFLIKIRLSHNLDINRNDIRIVRNCENRLVVYNKSICK